MVDSKTDSFEPHSDLSEANFDAHFSGDNELWKDIDPRGPEKKDDKASKTSKTELDDESSGLEKMVSGLIADYKAIFGNDGKSRADKKHDNGADAKAGVAPGAQATELSSAKKKSEAQNGAHASSGFEGLSVENGQIQEVVTPQGTFRAVGTDEKGNNKFLKITPGSDDEGQAFNGNVSLKDGKLLVTDADSGKTQTYQPKAAKYDNLSLNNEGKVEQLDTADRSYRLVGRSDGKDQYLVTTANDQEGRILNGSLSVDNGKVTVTDHEAGVAQTYRDREPKASVAAPAATDSSTLYEGFRQATVAATHAIAGGGMAAAVDGLLKDPSAIQQIYGQVAEAAQRASAQAAEHPGVSKPAPSSDSNSGEAKVNSGTTNPAEAKPETGRSDSGGAQASAKEQPANRDGSSTAADHFNDKPGTKPTDTPGDYGIGSQQNATPAKQQSDLNALNAAPGNAPHSIDVQHAGDVQQNNPAGSAASPAVRDNTGASVLPNNSAQSSLSPRDALFTVPGSPRDGSAPSSALARDSAPAGTYQANQALFSSRTDLSSVHSTSPSDLPSAHAAALTDSNQKANSVAAALNSSARTAANDNLARTSNTQISATDAARALKQGESQPATADRARTTDNTTQRPQGAANPNSEAARVEQSSARVAFGPQNLTQTNLDRTSVNAGRDGTIDGSKITPQQISKDQSSIAPGSKSQEVSGQNVQARTESALGTKADQSAQSLAQRIDLTQSKAMDLTPFKTAETASISRQNVVNQLVPVNNLTPNIGQVLNSSLNSTAFNPSLNSALNQALNSTFNQGLGSALNASLGSAVNAASNPSLRGLSDVSRSPESGRADAQAGLRAFDGATGRVDATTRFDTTGRVVRSTDLTGRSDATGAVALAAGRNEGRYMIAELTLAMVLAAGGIRRVLPSDNLGKGDSNNSNGGSGGGRRQIERELSNKMREPLADGLKFSTTSFKLGLQKDGASLRNALLVSNLASGKRIWIGPEGLAMMKTLSPKGREVPGVIRNRPVEQATVGFAQTRLQPAMADAARGGSFAHPADSSELHKFLNSQQNVIDDALAPFLNAAQDFIEMDNPFNTLRDAISGDSRRKRKIGENSNDLERRSGADGDGDDNGDEDEDQTQKNVVMLRPTVLIGTGQTLVSIAEDNFSDPYIGWLIADLNKANSHEHYIDGKRIVEFHSRQQLTMPVWQDIVEFYGSMPLEARPENLITIVNTTEIDREVIDNVLRPIVSCQK